MHYNIYIDLSEMVYFWQHNFRYVVKDKKLNRKEDAKMKTKRILAAVLSAALAITSAAVPVLADESDDAVELAAEYTWEVAGKDGLTAETAYEISTAAQFKEFADAVNNGTTFKDVYFKLTDDIDLAGSAEDQWVPIGWNTGSSSTYKFQGVFDGGYDNGDGNIECHTIRGLYIDATNGYDRVYGRYGLFGYVDGKSAIVKNLTVYGQVTGAARVGGIIGDNTQGQVINCHSYVNVESLDARENSVGATGGVVGINTMGTISGCSNSGKVTCKNYAAGGIVGYNNMGNVEECNNEGNVDGATKIGGIVGNDNGDGIINCYNTGYIKGTGGNNAGTGGIMGYSNGTKINGCYNTGTVEGTVSNTGGILGYSNGVTIKDCYNLGNIIGVNNVGGICGQASGPSAHNISSSFNSGKVNGKSDVGGIIGYLTASFGDLKGTISDTYYDTTKTNKGVGSLGRDITFTEDEGVMEPFGGDLSELNGKLGDGWDFSDGIPQITENRRKLPGKVIINTNIGGKVTADCGDAGATEGATVTLTVQCSEGYKLGEISAVSGSEGTEVTLTSEPAEDGNTLIYTFDMPATDVTVTATFMTTENNVVVDVPAVGKPSINGAGVVEGIDENTFAEWSATVKDTSELAEYGDMIADNKPLMDDAKDALPEAVGDVYVHYVTDLEFALLNYTATEEDKSMRIDVTPMRSIYVSTEENLTRDEIANYGSDPEIEQVRGPKEITINNDVAITLPIPTNFAEDGTKIRVEHNHDGSVYVYRPVVKDGKITFTAHGLSTFTLTLKDTDPTVALEFENVGSVDNAEVAPNDTITIPAKSNVDKTTWKLADGIEASDVTVKQNGTEITQSTGEIKLEFGSNILEIQSGGNTYYVNIFRAAPEKLSLYFVKGDGAREYNIVLKAPGDEVIHRLNTADLTFELTSDGSTALTPEDGMAYNITAAEGIDLIDAGDGRYEFHFAGKDFEEGTPDTLNEITLGTVKFTGYSDNKVVFKVKTDIDPDTNIVHATTEDDNIVSDYVVKGTEELPAGKGELGVNTDLDDDSNTYLGTITDTFGVEQQDVTINVMFPNKLAEGVEDDYIKDMTVTVEGGAAFKSTIPLGNYGEGSDPAIKVPEGANGVTSIKAMGFDYTTQKAPEADAEPNANGYQINMTVPVPADTGARYTFTFKGAGYRTYSVDAVIKGGSTGPHVINVWNNAMDSDVTVTASDGFKDVQEKVTFLAGDIDDSKYIDLYDLSAAVAYFGKTGSDMSGYVQYDLNRDGAIDSKDIAMVLVSWNK